jgi:chemotaxis protein CheD
VAHIVGISDRRVARSPDIISTYALGSCIGVALYDPTTHIGGLAHIMLPDSAIAGGEPVDRKRFADTAVPDMVREMSARGADMTRVTAKLAGGANMFNISGDTPIASIGSRNLAGVKRALSDIGIRVVAEDTGHNYGRTLHFDLATGSLNVQSLGKSNKEI